MYAVIETGGKQYKVKKDQQLKIEKLAAETGAQIEFDKVLLIGKDDDVKIGEPYLKGAKVLAEIVAHGRGEKIHIIKFKRRKHHLKHQGHRQYFTKVKITDIHAA